VGFLLSLLRRELTTHINNWEAMVTAATLPRGGVWSRAWARDVAMTRGSGRVDEAINPSSVDGRNASNPLITSTALRITRSASLATTPATTD